jgi:1,4-alpha-glucan branching enzyme
VQRLVRDLNELARREPPLYALDHDWRGFEWIDFKDAERSVITFLRWDADKEHGILFAFNFTPAVQEGYRIGVPRRGSYGELLNTDADSYGGSGVGNLGAVKSEPVAAHGRDQSVTVTVPPLAAIAFRVPA